jgi:ribosomal protein L16 Arg81 hydroxylase
MKLEDILDPISVSVFFKEYWGKKHLIIRRNKFKDIYTFDDFTKYINRYPNIKGLQIIDYDNFGTRWCKNKRVELQQPNLNKEQIVKLWKDGKTMVVPTCEYENKELLDICFEFERYFGWGSANVYASPSAGSKSFPTHNDRTENFLFHTYGETKWTMYKEFKDNEILEEFILEAGDLLYIPQYKFHKVETIGPRMLCSIHFNNKKNQRLDKFIVTSDKANNRDKWFDLSPEQVLGGTHGSIN